MCKKSFVAIVLFLLALPLAAEGDAAANPNGVAATPRAESAPANQPPRADKAPLPAAENGARVNPTVSGDRQDDARPDAAAKQPPAKDAAEVKTTGRKKHVIKLADDQEEPPPPEKDPATYSLSNMRMIDEYTERDVRPFDRGEHMLISAFMGALGGGTVGGMIGLYNYDQNDNTKTLNSIYTFGGIGAGVGVLAGLTTTFFERGKVEQFAIGKFLLKYSWYGAIGGALIGGGIGLIPYASSGDYSDILRYAGYGAGVGVLAGLVLFFVDLPEHLKLYTYRRGDQNMVMLTLRF